MIRTNSFLVGAAFSLSVGFVTQAKADVITLTDGAGLEYEIYHDQESTTFTTTTGSITTTITSSNPDEASAAVDDATYNSITYTTESGTETGELDDAFDDYGAVKVNDVYFNLNGPATLGCDDQELSFNTQTIGDLEVTRRVYVPDDDEFLRWLTIIENTGSSTVTVNLVFDENNMGHDDDMAITATSSGDALVTAADHWVASRGPDDEVRVAHVFSNQNAEVGLGDITFEEGDDEPRWSYEAFDVAAGETAILMNFVSGQPSVAKAEAKAAELVKLPSNTVRCMTDDELDKVVNFVKTSSKDGSGCSFNADQGLNYGSLAFLALIASALIWRRRAQAL